MPRCASNGGPLCSQWADISADRRLADTLPGVVGSAGQNPGLSARGKLPASLATAQPTGADLSRLARGVGTAPAGAAW